MNIIIIQKEFQIINNECEELNIKMDQNFKKYTI